MGYPNIYDMTYIHSQKWEISDDVQTDRQTDTARVYINRQGINALACSSANEI
jgi:hypothetical protein